MPTSSNAFVSEIKAEKSTMQWTMRNFHGIPFMGEISISGPTFHLGSEVRSAWTLCICKKRHEDEESLGFCLKKKTKNYHYEVVTYTIHIQSEDGRTQECLKQLKTNGVWNTEFHFIQTQDLSEENKTIFMSTDLTVVCSMEYVLHKQEIKSEVDIPRSEFLIEAMEHLIGSIAFSDVTLISNDGKRFRCHKAILCSRSYIFNNLCQDLKPFEILHLGIDKKTAKAIIFYIYTRQMKHMVTKEEYRELGIAARKFHMSRLETICKRIYNHNWKVECLCPKCKYDYSEIEDIEQIEMREGEIELQERELQNE